jgi:hypothetical protein
LCVDFRNGSRMEVGRRGLAEESSKDGSFPENSIASIASGV